MSQREKLLQKWKENTPVSEPVDTVLAVLDWYFPGWRTRKGTGSHHTVHDRRLASHPDFQGSFTVPVSGGQIVKGRYLKRIVDAIEFVGESES